MAREGLENFMVSRYFQMRGFVIFYDNERGE